MKKMRSTMERLFKKHFSMPEVVSLLAFVLLGIAIYSYAQTTVPNTFTAGETAVAEDVNENFRELANTIDTIELTPGPEGPQGPQGPDGPAGADGSPDTADQVRDKFFTGTSCVGNSAEDIMVKVGPLCVDKYPASVWSNSDGTGTQYGIDGDNYPSTFPDNGIWTAPLYAISKAGVSSSKFLTWFQAQQICALSDKQLPTSGEWLMVAIGSWDVNSLSYIHITTRDNYSILEWVGDEDTPFSVGTSSYDNMQLRCVG